MSYKTREFISKMFNRFQLSVRYNVRRGYLRKDLKKFKSEGKTLSHEQKEELLQYWKQFSSHFTPVWHQFYYEKTGVFDVHFIPEDLMMTDIEDYLNDWSSAHGIDNKNNYKMYFPEIRHPRAAFRKMRGIFHNDMYGIISKEQAIENCLQMGHVIFKCAMDSGKGGGIKIWKQSDGVDALKTIINNAPNDYLAQEFIKQHKDLEAINPTSVNSVRIVTFLWDNTIDFLTAYLRMGFPGAEVDNVSAGGCCSAVRRDGTLVGYGLNKSAEKIYEHPSGFKFNDFKVPSWEKIVKSAIKLHEKMGNYKLVSWDIAVAEDGEPIFIEMNLIYGAMEYHQLFNGPLFGDRTDEILNAVYHKKHK